MNMNNITTTLFYNQPVF